MYCHIVRFDRPVPVWTESDTNSYLLVNFLCCFTIQSDLYKFFVFFFHTNSTNCSTCNTGAMRCKRAEFSFKPRTRLGNSLISHHLDFYFLSFVRRPCATCNWFVLCNLRRTLYYHFWPLLKDSRSFTVAYLLRSERASNVTSALHRASLDSRLSGWLLHT